MGWTSCAIGYSSNSIEPSGSLARAVRFFSAGAEGANWNDKNSIAEVAAAQLKDALR